MQKIIRLVCASDRGQRVGQDAANARLTNEDARMIRVLHFEHGISERALADKYEVSRRAIRDILRGKTYPEVYKMVRRSVKVEVEHVD